jgi:hypothetical protein
MKKIEHFQGAPMTKTGKDTYEPFAKRSNSRAGAYIWFVPLYQPVVCDTIEHFR